MKTRWVDNNDRGVGLVKFNKEKKTIERNKEIFPGLR